MAISLNPKLTLKPAPVPPTPPPNLVMEFTREELAELRQRVMVDFSWTATGHQEFWGEFHDLLNKAVRTIDKG